MPIHSIFRFKNHALMMALAAAFPLTSYGAGAAKVDFAVGAVNAVSAAGAQRTINKGAELGSGESIVTGNGGRAQLRFTDGGMVSLQPESEFKVDNYHFSGKEDGEEKGFFSLLKGGLRTITGLVGRNNKNAYKVNTSVATIGIRGTEFTIAYTGTNSLSVSTGEGMIEVCNNVGCVTIPAGSSANVSGPDTQIKRTEIKPRLDPAQPLTDVQPVFSTSDSRQDNGLIAPVSAPLVSGSQNYVSWAGIKGGSANEGIETSNTQATFDDASVLTSFSDSYGATYKASDVAGGFSMDGVIGWGTLEYGGLRLLDRAQGFSLRSRYADAECSDDRARRFGRYLYIGRFYNSDNQYRLDGVESYGNVDRDLRGIQFAGAEHFHRCFGDVV
jgi:hypothetical protein